MERKVDVSLKKVSKCKWCFPLQKGYMDFFDSRCTNPPVNQSKRVTLNQCLEYLFLNSIENWVVAGSFRVSGSSRAKERAFLHLLVGAPCEKTYALVWQDNGCVLPQKRFNNVAQMNIQLKSRSFSEDLLGGSSHLVSGL